MDKPSKRRTSPRKFWRPPFPFSFLLLKLQSIFPNYAFLYSCFLGLHCFFLLLLSNYRDWLMTQSRHREPRPQGRWASRQRMWSDSCSLNLEPSDLGPKFSFIQPQITSQLKPSRFCFRSCCLWLWVCGLFVCFCLFYLIPSPKSWPFKGVLSSFSSAPWKLPLHDPELDTEVRASYFSLMRVLLSFIIQRGLLLKAKVRVIHNYDETIGINQDHYSVITILLTSEEPVCCVGMWVGEYAEFLGRQSLHPSHCSQTKSD